MYDRNQKQAISKIKADVKRKYSYVCEPDLDIAVDMAVGDYLAIRYPSDNSRPSVEDLNFDFFVSQWVYKRMIDILGRAGMNLKSYSENSLRYEYASSNIDPSLVAQILPKAGVPK